MYCGKCMLYKNIHGVFRRFIWGNLAVPLFSGMLSETSYFDEDP